MKRTLAILISAVLLPAIGSSRLAAQGGGPPNPLGIISGQAVGRVNLDSSLRSEVLMYFPAIDGIGTNLFDGPPGVKTSYFSARSNKFDGTALVNSSVGILMLAPDSEPITMYVYYNPSPNRDFADPDSFSDGQLVGEYPVSAGSTTLVDGLNANFTYSAQLASSTDFTFRGRTYNAKSLLPAFTVFLNGKAPLLSDLSSGFTIPMAGMMIAAERAPYAKR